MVTQSEIDRGGLGNGESRGGIKFVPVTVSDRARRQYRGNLYYFLDSLGVPEELYVQTKLANNMSSPREFDLDTEVVYVPSEYA